MSNDRLKFRQPYFLQDDTFSHWHYWGWMSEGEFVGPLSLGHNVKGEMGQQWTGLYDSEGVEIYEGDIVSVEGEDYEVIYSDRYACFQLSAANSLEFYLVKSFVNPFKVVGNIYDA